MAISSASVMWKVVLLAVLQAMAVAAVNGEVEGSSLQRGGPGGRFLVEGDHESDAGGRRLLNGNLCGRGYAPNYNCRSILRLAKQPTCCNIGGLKVCKDIGDTSDLHCGACNKRCGFGLDCCAGKCVGKDTDRNNCERCGRRCPKGQPCRRGMCGYNGKDPY